MFLLLQNRQWHNWHTLGEKKIIGFIKQRRKWHLKSSDTGHGRGPVIAEEQRPVLAVKGQATWSCIPWSRAWTKKQHYLMCFYSLAVEKLGLHILIYTQCIVLGIKYHSSFQSPFLDSNNNAYILAKQLCVANLYRSSKIIFSKKKKKESVLGLPHLPS